MPAEVGQPPNQPWVEAGRAWREPGWWRAANLTIWGLQGPEDVSQAAQGGSTWEQIINTDREANKNYKAPRALQE